MRLIHTTTFELKEFFENQIPPYAILSHRWENEEVTFQDLRDGRGKQMKSWAKVRDCCSKAAENGFDYAWIDSCCIDKTSSAELSEAINSMFRWYTDAQVCYAFLSDVSSGLDPRKLDSDFRRSKWFTRGWTLQELLAPTNLVFFDSFWVEIGTKSSLADLLTSITGVKAEHLFDISGASIAQKMSWAARRVTTRIEDQAYCLMGLFDVNMPPLYGEGERAFSRLQLEILGMSNDASIFAWTDGSMYSSLWRKHSLLARSPKAFYNSGGVVPMLSHLFKCNYNMTNRGLRINTPCLLFGGPAPMPHVSMRGIGIVMPLACALDGERLAVRLEPNLSSDDQFHRCGGQTVVSMTELYQHVRNEVKEGLQSRIIYVLGLEASCNRPVLQQLSIKVQALEENGYRLFQKHIGESGSVKYSVPCHFHQTTSVIIRNNEILWEPYGSKRISSLLLIFKKHSSRLSLQIFSLGERVGLKIVLTDHHRNQGGETEESIFGEHARPWKNYADRVSKSLPHGRSISASVTIVNRPDIPYDGHHRLLHAVVEIKLGEDRSGSRSDRQRSNNIPSSDFPRAKRKKSKSSVENGATYVGEKDTNIAKEGG